jgi:hypothetical protein
LVLNESDVLHFVGKNLNGTNVQSTVGNLPIAIYIGTNCPQGASPCNYKLESIPSINYYNTEFVYVSPLTLNNNTTMSNGSNTIIPSSLFSIIALNPNTVVQINNQPITLASGIAQTIPINDSFTYINSSSLINVQVIDTYVNQSKILVNVLSTGNFFNFGQFSSNNSDSNLVNQTLVVIARTSDLQQPQSNTSSDNNATSGNNTAGGNNTSSNESITTNGTNPQSFGITLNQQSLSLQSFSQIPFNSNFSASIISLDQPIAYSINSSFPIAAYYYSLSQTGNLYGSPINFLFNVTNNTPSSF